MGLLEKAYKYKQQINSQGKETLIDRIKGPAETEFISENVEAGVYESGAEAKPDNDESVEMVQVDEIKDAAEDENMKDVKDSGIGEEQEQLSDSDIVSLSDADLKEFVEMGTEVTTSTEKTAPESKNENIIEQDEELFSLPESDDTSPLDVLKKQKEEPKTAVQHQIHGADEKETALPERSGYALAENEPFGVEDDPSSALDAGDVPTLTEAGEPAELMAGKKKEDEVVEPAKEESTIRDMEPESFGENDMMKAADAGERPRNEEAGDVDEQPVKRDKKFQDFIVLYEIGKEILRSETRRDLYDVVLFSIMGQIGASSSSILIGDVNNENRWIVGDSRGVTIRNKELFFECSEGIMMQIIGGKKIIDLDEYKNQQMYKDEYYKFVSIDGRLVSPLNYNGTVIGAVVMGDKITIGDYNDEEKDFILAVSEVSAIALHKITLMEKLQQENVRHKSELELIEYVDSLQYRMLGDTNLQRFGDMLKAQFGELGIVSYGVFIKDDRNDEYSIIYGDSDDVVHLREYNHSFPYNHPFIEFIKELKDDFIADDFRRMKIISDAFNEKQLRMMSRFWLYPFKLGVHLEGFVLVTYISDEGREREIQSMLSRLTKILFPYITSIKKYDLRELMYLDYIDPVLKRVDRELENARNLQIPLTLVLFSIKNFKRYYSIYGIAEAKKIILMFEDIIRSRLSDHDFSVRIDRSKILIILPGKNKRYSVPLANTIRNEILQNFKKKEMQLLVTFLTAEYPEDGEDLNSLLDSID